MRRQDRSPVSTRSFEHEPPPTLSDGSRVAVIGSGPAGSLFAYFLLGMAARVGLALDVDVYESKEFVKPGPQGCNMCGGIVSETLVQNLAAEGVNLPDSVVQRGLDSYVLHMDVGSVKIGTPLGEMRIGAVHRGGGPRDLRERKWQSFDHHLLAQALNRGARLVPLRVDAIEREGRQLMVKAHDGSVNAYDLVAPAVGVNSRSLEMFEALGIGYERPQLTRTFIREYKLGADVIERALGPSMHVFLLNIPRLEFAAIIPKGEYVTMCLLGHDIDNALIDAFVSAPEVRTCMPAGWDASAKSCQCMPYINVRGVRKPYADGVVFLGDCGVTRLYKDGIGAAYRTAKAAARTAVLEGISSEAFATHYLPVCRSIAKDNSIGRLAFTFTEIAQHAPLLRRGLLRMAVAEQVKPGASRRLSAVLWDMFSGSAPYADIFKRMLHPAFASGFVWSVAASTVPSRQQRQEVPHA